MVCNDLTNNLSHNLLSHGGLGGGTRRPPHQAAVCTPGSQSSLPGFASDVPPFELDSSSESLTEKINSICGKPLSNNSMPLDREQIEYLRQWEEFNGQGVGACLNVFRSGEITGGSYSLGRKSAPGRRGKLVSSEFTRQARKIIRRAVESRVTAFKLFITLTFDPKISKLDESGRVDQNYAKEKIKRFLNTIKKRYDRMAEKTGKDHWRLSYIWVAEIQEKKTKNIHFHILVDRDFIDVKYLVKIWGQAANSVNVKKLNDQDHAANYMLKYMKKGNCPIEGKRYGLTQNLINGARPVKFRFDGRDKRNAFLRVIQDLSWEIEQNGGHVIEWGFHIPTPRRERVWRDKKGAVRTKKGTSSNIGLKLLNQLKEAVDVVDADIDNLEGDNEYIPF